MAPTSVIAVPELRLERTDRGLWKIAAMVGGAEVFFESKTPLSTRAEVLLCSFLIPSMAFHANLEVEGALDPVFLQNLAFVGKRVREWWPDLSGGEVRALGGAAHPPGPAAGMFYTGGVDSSYVLQQLHPTLRYAVFVEGFDISLENEERLRRARSTLGAAADACGLDLVTVRTNLRTHPFFRLARWGISHIGALSAIGHALGDLVHTMYVAASDVPPPWGSAPDLDAAWSSGSLKIENFSGELSRLERVASIARWELLRKRLRVCLAIKTKELNCGMCEKCVRTRMQLFVVGARDGLDSFEEGPPLRSAIGSVYDIHPEVEKQWKEILVLLTDRRLSKQVRRALAGRRQSAIRRALRQLRLVSRRRFRAATSSGSVK